MKKNSKNINPATKSQPTKDSEKNNSNTPFNQNWFYFLLISLEKIKASK